MERRFIGPPALNPVNIPTELSRIKRIVKWISNIFHFNQFRLLLLVTVGSYTWRNTLLTSFTSSCAFCGKIVCSKQTHANSRGSQYFVRICTTWSARIHAENKSERHSFRVFPSGCWKILNFLSSNSCPRWLSANLAWNVTSYVYTCLPMTRVLWRKQYIH